MKLAALPLALALLAPVGCTDDMADLYDGEQEKSEDGKADSSLLATFIDVEYEATFTTDYSYNTNQSVQDHALMTVGQLNHFNSVGRVDKLVIISATKRTVGGKVEITYRAKLPVAWGKRDNVPATVDLTLPNDFSSAGQMAFAEKYGHDCVDWGAHDVDAGSMFYYFRPLRSGCEIAATDASVVSGAVSPSPVQTTGKFPEYHKIWEDNVFNVVAIFGKYEDGATTSSDAGISAYNQFVGAMKTELKTRNLTTIPATVSNTPGVATPDVEFNATLPDGKQIHVVAMLTDNVTQGLSNPTFRARYETLSTRADFIVYNGHAGLGTNVRALAQRGKWVAGQYVVVFMNGCDTFAYIDDALFTAHKAVNPDDTTGYKYVDIANNAMPSFFASMSGATMAMFRGLAAHDDPKTYEQIFRSVDSSQVVLVVGEQDNTYTPGGGGTPTAWPGLTDSGTVKKGDIKKYETPTLAAGTYQFDMTGTADADLYVRQGRAPTATSFDCRPYKTGSNESCKVTLAAPTKIHVQVRGYATTSNFQLTGKKL